MEFVEAPKEINVAVLRSLFELLVCGLAQLATQGSEEPVKQLIKLSAGSCGVCSTPLPIRSRLSSGASRCCARTRCANGAAGWTR